MTEKAMTNENRPVTAEDLVRAIQHSPKAVFDLAITLGAKVDLSFPKFSDDYYSAIIYIANLITLPEQEQAAEVGS